MRFVIKLVRLQLLLLATNKLKLSKSQDIEDRSNSFMMSSKPGSKATKHSSQGHKKKGTPDLHARRGSGSPTGSLEGVEGGGTAAHPLDEVLAGEEIQALRIVEENLRKLHPPHPPSSPPSSSSYSSPAPHLSTRRVVVRRAGAPDDARKTSKRVAVLRPLPSDVSVSATRTLALGGGGGKGGGGRGLQPHSMLGTTEEYTAQLAAQGMSEDVSPVADMAPVSPPLHHLTSSSSPHTFSYLNTVVPRETHALQHWDKTMESRRHQQDYLAKKLQKSPERLAMNQGDGYRAVQEERMQIDRAIPPLDYGKGYRVGSEFWSQTVRVGDNETGINATLTRSEKGQPLPLELIGIPKTVQREKGMMGVERNAPLHYTWQATPYLASRTRQLQPTLTDMQDTQPVMNELEVVGHTLRTQLIPRDRSLDSLGEEEEEEGEESYSEDSLSSSEEEGRHGVLDMLPDTHSEPLLGPGLTIGGHLLKWEGPPKPDLESSLTALEPVDLRVTFESGVEEMATSHIAMENSGTTALYYSWKLMPQPNPLQTVQAGDTQRFYFDVRGGVLLPGQQLSFPFVFKSPNAGIFSETWALQTGPVLAGGRGVRIMLRGVAFQEDINTHKRDELEREMNHRVAVTAAQRLINQLVNSIATPPHSPPPLQTTPTEEDVFNTKNPHLFYHYNIVQQLKTLYDEILRPELLEDQSLGDTARHTATPTGKEKGKAGGGGGGVGGGKKEKEREKGGAGGKEKKGKAAKEEVHKESVSEIPEEPAKPVCTVPGWDLSTDSLLQVVLGVEEEDEREEKLKLLSSLLGDLSFPPPALPPVSSYSLVYQLVSEMVEQISGSSQHLCGVMGLPQRDSCPKSSTTEDDQLSSTPSSSAVVSKKEKDKKGKKQDAKKGGAGKDKERAPSRSKVITGRKSRSSANSKEAESAEASSEQQSTPQPVLVDPILEKKYKENFYAAVYGILVDTMDRMTLMLPEQT